jgi:hypothetical protein
LPVIVSTFLMVVGRLTNIATFCILPRNLSYLLIV